MDFRKKLKERLYAANAFVIIGVLMVFVSNYKGTASEASLSLSSFGAALVAIGIVKIRNHFIITRSEESIRKQEIAENDERNIAIANRAKSVAFSIYGIISFVIVVILEAVGKIELAYVLAFSICLLLIIYLISYYIIRKRW